MTIKKLQDKAFANALKHGFHHKGQNIGEMLMLIVSELSEALEADRKNLHTVNEHGFLEKYANGKTDDSEDGKVTCSMIFMEDIKDTFEDELADALIRILDLAGYLNIDLQSHVLAKMRYNESRPYKHGKEY